MSDNGSSGDADRFEPHSYAPSYIDGNGRSVDIFTVTGVVQVAYSINYNYVELLNSMYPNLTKYFLNREILTESLI
jgi:hypothetical protein